MKKYYDIIIISLISIAVSISVVNFYSTALAPKDTSPWSNGLNNGFGLQTNDIANMYTNYIDQWKKEVSKAFDEAEIKVFNKTPIPDVIGVHEDPAKCICKGTGVIVQGDNHKTPCPYHSKQFGRMHSLLEEMDLIFKPL